MYKQAFCYHVKTVMSQRGISKTRMMKIMHVSKSTMDRILADDLPERMGIEAALHFACYSKIPMKELFEKPGGERDQGV